MLVELATGAMVALRGGAAYGIVERVFVLAALGWLVVESLRQWWRAGHRLGSAPAREAGALVLVAGWCVLAGVTTTVLAPVTMSTSGEPPSPKPAECGVFRRERVVDTPHSYVFPTLADGVGVTCPRSR